MNKPKVVDRMGLAARSFHFESVWRLTTLAGLVGVIAGLGAVAFQLLSHLVVRYGLETVAGYQPQAPLGDWQILGSVAPLLGGFVPWMILPIITLGGLLSGIIVYSLAPEAEGHGTDAAIKAYHRNRGIIRPIVPLVKIVCSALTIGSGGSGGREGPIAQIGAGFGSFLATRLKLSEYDRRILLAAGLGAGIAAIFKAPLAGALFATEVLYRDEDFEAEALIPAFISCTVAYCVFGMVARYAFGVRSAFDPLFVVSPGLKFSNPMLLVPLALLALVMVGASRLYVKCFYGLQNAFAKLPIRKHFRPAVGALAAGVVGLAIFYSLAYFGPAVQMDSLNVLSYGYGLLQSIMDGQFHYNAGAGVVLLLLVGLGKIVTTSLTIGSGGSGGVFGPSMVIGGALGGAMGLLLKAWMPHLVTRVDVFVILGMASFFSAAAKTPVSTIIMVSELTSGYELLVPAMWVSALAYSLSRGWSIYREQVPSRIYSPAHRGDAVAGVLKGLTVSDIWKPGQRQIVTVEIDQPLTKAMELIPVTTQTVFPVVNKNGDFYGLFTLGQVRQFLFDKQLGQAAIAQDAAMRNVEPLRLDTDLAAAVMYMAESNYDELPILHNSKVIGTLRRQEIMAAYNARLNKLQQAPELPRPPL